MCPFGMAPSALNVLPQNRTVTSAPLANIMDNKPMVNIMPFGMCTSLANPTVASATAAAWGVLTPMPCIPAITAPWAPGSPTVLIHQQANVRLRRSDTDTQPRGNYYTDPITEGQQWITGQ